MSALIKRATFWLADLWPAQAFCVLLRFLVVGLVLGFAATVFVLWGLHVANFLQ